MKIIDSIITSISILRHPEKKETVALAKLLRNKTGLEVGGPSAFFKRKSYYPIYLFARKIDGVNFNTNTVWEGKIEAGDTYEYLEGYATGRQYITEASELTGIENNKYDFLLSCHSLEHVANPVKALKRWHEVIKPGGTLVLILPNKEITFDIDRPYTTFNHLLQDFENNTSENDDTHFAEVLKLHNIEKDAGVTDNYHLKERISKNFENRCVHHHVFNFETITQMLEYAGFKVNLQKIIYGLNLFTLAKKV